MRFCETHVARVRGMCCDLGLESRISRDDAHLRERLAKRDTFDIDPLYHALLALRMLAVAVAERNNVHAKLLGCPLCFWRARAAQDDWLNQAAKAVADLVARRDVEKLADEERTRKALEDVSSL